MMIVISIAKLCDLLSVKLGRESAENLTKYIEHQIKEELTEKSQTPATKEDLSEAKIEMINWMFVFWISIVFMLIGLYIKN